MNTGVDIQLVKERYERMSDVELVRIATHDATGLTPAALEVVKAEVRKRNLQLGEEIIQGVEAQNREYTDEEIDAYCHIIRSLPCPSCGRSDEPLNATITAEVMSFVVFTQYKKHLKVACPSCLDKFNNAALTTTALLGWWGIPWGIIRTIQALDRNWKSKVTNRADVPNENLCTFVLQNIGAIEAYNDNRSKLKEVLILQNRE